MTTFDLPSVTAAQAPGFQRVRIGDLLITALYDGFRAIPAEDLHGGTPAEVGQFLAEAFLPDDGDRCTAVIAFLVEGHGQLILIDAGGGPLLGPDTGHVALHLAAAQTDPAEIDHVLLTHLHPVHAGGLISPDGQAVFPRATVHVVEADAEHWLDPVDADASTGVQRFIYETAVRVLAPYRDTGRFLTFAGGEEVIPGVTTVNLNGHTPGHTGYLFGHGDQTVLFWGDTIHSHAVQLRRPFITIAYDSDEAAAVASRRRVLELTSSNRWLVGAAHLPFPGLGHVRRDPDRYTWVPVSYAPVVESTTKSPAAKYIA
jgi:glyoxylase-like metal-dependent hydrolase (beta-lactamase superfamily II)